VRKCNNSCIIGNPEGILLKLALMGATPALDCGREPAGHSCSSKGRARRTTETMTKWDKAGAPHSAEKLWV
jgi:hypothetical protein